MTVSDILLWLGETSLAVSILIVFVLLLRKPFAKYFGARAAYALWLAPLARLFLPELAVLPRPEELAAIPAMVWTADTAMLGAAAPATPAFDLWAFVAAAGLLIWAIVAIAWFSLKLETQSRFVRERMAASSPASPALAQEAAMVAKNIGVRRTPRIRVCEDGYGPAVMGVFRPVLLLPANFEEAYSAEERRLALAHEFSHIARGDLIAQTAAFAAQAAQWPNPIAHIAIRAFRVDQEAACDAYVMARCERDKETAGDYASAIIKAACGGAKTAHGLSLGHPVKERLMLLKSKHSPLRTMLGAASAVALVAGGLAATANYSYAAETKKKIDLHKIDAKSKSTTVIELERGETFKMKGAEKASKIEIREEDGARTVRLYDAKGKMISEDTYGPDENFPFQTIEVKDKDGKEKSFSLAAPAGAHKMMFIGEGGDKDVRVVVEALGDENFEFFTDDGEHKLMHFTSANGPGATFIGDCSGDMSEGDPVKLEWKDEDSDKSGTMIRHEIICLTGDDAKPENRAQALREVIARMEVDAKKDAERRAQLIEELRDRLDAVEKESKKK